MKILWKRGEIAPLKQFLLFSTIFCYLLLDFHIQTGTRFSLRDKRLFEISGRDNESRLHICIQPSYPHVAKALEAYFGRHGSLLRVCAPQQIASKLRCSLRWDQIGKYGQMGWARDHTKENYYIIICGPRHYINSTMFSCLIFDVPFVACNVDRAALGDRQRVVHESKAVQIHVHNNCRCLYVPRMPGCVKNPQNNNMSVPVKSI